MHNLTYVIQQALVLVLVVSGPPIVLALIIGFVISVFQAATQIQEQTLSFAPKLVIIFGVLGLAGPWMVPSADRELSAWGLRKHKSC
jgi:flagellar biosynthetic protein FliQ